MTSLSLAGKARLGTEVLVTYGRVRWLLSRTSLPDTLAGLRRVPVDRDAEIGTARLANAVRRTLRVLPTDTRCLTQSVVLASLLARRGLDAKVIIGVRSPEQFAAHAWVEVDGRPLLPTGGGEFHRLTEL